MQPCRADLALVRADPRRPRIQYGSDAGAGCEADDGGESGSAVLEFIFLALLLLIPVVYLILTVGQIQGASYATVGAADQAARVYASAENEGQGRDRAGQAAMLAVTEYGFDANSLVLEYVCTDGACLAPGSNITVTVRLQVPLPLVPQLPGMGLAATTVSSSATQIVGRFR